MITISAYFSNTWRQATKDAQTFTGINVSQSINKPTAVAIADKLQEEAFLAYDPRGELFDVSVQEIEDGLFEVKSTHGDTELEGEDHISILVTCFWDQIFEDHRVDIHSNPQVNWRLTFINVFIIDVGIYV